jgi:hypothetical protein
MKTRPLARATFIVATPAVLATLEMFHPHPHDLLEVNLTAWLAVHYAQILLFPLAALALVMLVTQRHDVAAAVCRIASFVFAASYIAFDTAAGIVTGILVGAARASGSAERWRPAIDAIWAHPIVGGTGSPFLAVLGAVALSIGTVAAAVSMRRAGASWLPVVLLGLSGFGIGLFKTHAWPGGPLTFAAMAIASAWLLIERRKTTT